MSDWPRGCWWNPWIPQHSGILDKRVSFSLFICHPFIHPSFLPLSFCPSPLPLFIHLSFLPSFLPSIHSSPFMFYQLSFHPCIHATYLSISFTWPCSIHSLTPPPFHTLSQLSAHPPIYQLICPSPHVIPNHSLTHSSNQLPAHLPTNPPPPSIPFPAHPQPLALIRRPLNTISLWFKCQLLQLRTFLCCIALNEKLHSQGVVLPKQKF